MSTEDIQTNNQSLKTSKIGSINIVIGCMYSGKTSEVIRECKKWFSISRKAICINFEGDTRYGDDEQLYNHDLNSVECIKVSKLEQVNIQSIIEGDIILINEGQFFDDLIEYCQLWCETYGKNIIVSGLDGDFKRKSFGKILDLIPYSESVVKLHAFCSMCANGTHAHFTWRLSKEQEQIVIGTSNYIPVCRKHYVELSRS